jgi:hypothetical protein
MNKSMPDDEEVGRLVREAGPHPSISADDLTAIRRAARAEWQKRYAGNARFRIWRIAIPLAAAVAGLTLFAFWLLRNPPVVQAPVAAVIGSVERVTGDVRVWRSFNGKAELLHNGDKLRSGMLIATAGDSRSRAAVRLVGGQSLRIDNGGRALLVIASVVRLDRGAVYIDSPAGAVRDGLTVSTAAGDFNPAGTQFEVRIGAGGSTQLRVREGEVSLKRGTSSVVSRAGDALTIQPAGALIRGQIAPNDRAWDWVTEVAAIPPIEGRSLAWFLRWVARERGWTLAFEGDAASISETSILHGSVDQLTIEDALRTVAMSTGTETYYANGTLNVISASPTKSRLRR